SLIQPVGDLVLSDGFNTITVPQMKVDVIKSRTDDSGTVWEMRLLDRRWKWVDKGAVLGMYNQVQDDGTGKLIAWTIRSPAELAAILLREMGENPLAALNMPPGLSSADVANQTAYYEAGDNAPVTGTNLAVHWDGIPPAGALASLCEMYGRRIAYNLLSDTIDI